MRLVILGNSGSGKSFLARRLAGERELSHLDLDTLVWEPGEIAVGRPVEAVEEDLLAFAAREAWIIEGCYEGYLELALPRCTDLLYLDPGLEACLENTRRRPWEPHKYADPADQERRLPMLLGWVAAHYQRDDAWSYPAHLTCFEEHRGRKRRLASAGEV